MKNLNYMRNTFVRQCGLNDCGIACLAMLLNYTGRNSDADLLRETISVPENGLSLLDLRNLAHKFALNARCVTADICFLRKIRLPIILHTIDHKQENHFVVCFGAIKKQDGWHYLINDPAKQPLLVPESYVEHIWKSKAALYLEKLRLSTLSLKAHPWVTLLSLKSLPIEFWISIPLLNLCSAFLGIALSWMLQRGIDNSLAEKKTALIISVIVLLLIITVFKSLLTYIKQRILIKLNKGINEQLIDSIIKSVVNNDENKFVPGSGKSMKANLADVQKIQNAVSSFASVLLSEGFLVVFIVAGIYYSQMGIGLINTAYLVLVGILTAKRSPELMLQAAHLHELSLVTESSLTAEVQSSVEAQNAEIRFQQHQKNHKSYLSFARSLAVKISGFNLLNECIGTVNVIVVLAFCIVQQQLQAISYNSVMAMVILSYFITALMPKICNAFMVITEGAEVSHHFKQASSTEQL
ncbi:cysteine peptidase family C39 domain-containing protein [Mucilaginibacter sp. UYCu711]|uniref:cysteine peptidase family C39 domain-containing protein n=1 Tax=Mucilaginibacter sp. UYCu711 TaxID=3156339 RepID=UPI003D23A84E